VTAQKFDEPAAAERPPLVIIISPVTGRPGRYQARLPDAEVLCESTRTPFLDGARILIERGADPNSTFEMKRDAAAPHYDLRARLGVAASLTVDESRKTAFRKWKPFSPTPVAPGIAPNRDPVSEPPGGER
jgi:hypothetical protein